ncbi:MAG: ribulose-phosphate 3-epimerase, partial [Anaerovoracaceae bacterium]|nr:ribulose-phosphate 3-epimerase [Anaerovoracaceae bacterium]
LILVMSVNPGFGGQSFIEYTLEKTGTLDRIRRENGYRFRIEMDGGIGPENIKDVMDAGTDIAVAGSSVFRAGDIEKAVMRLTAAAEGR